MERAAFSWVCEGKKGRENISMHINTDRDHHHNKYMQKQGSQHSECVMSGLCSVHLKLHRL